MTNFINFSKMQALGNDFMVISTINQPIALNSQQIQAWSHRHRGIGFDQLLLIHPSRDAHFDYFYQIYNANGQEVGQCGNGARCVGLYIYRHLKPQKILRLQTISTTMQLEILDHHHVLLQLPQPEFQPQKLPLLGYTEQSRYTLRLPTQTDIELHAVNVGNPHAIVHITEPDVLNHMDLKSLGPAIEQHPAFPQGTNVSFMSILNDHELQIRVWERGCGETLACGSAALACAAVARKFYALNAHIQVHLPGGQLEIFWPDLQGPIQQQGPAQEIFQGRISIE